MLILIYTGLRVMELMEIETANVHISERYMVGGNKTAAGKNRVVPISRKVLPFVEKYYNSGNRYLIAGTSGPNSGLSYKQYRGAFNRVMQAMAMQHCPHDTRHTCATMLDRAGVSRTTMQHILGHAGEDLEEQVYIHKLLPDLLEGIDKL